MNYALIAALILAGFAAGVIFSSLVRVFIDRQISQLHTRAAAIEQAATEAADRLRARILDLEKKISGIV